MRNLTPDQLAAQELLQRLLHPTTTRVSRHRLATIVAQSGQPLTLLALSTMLAHLEVETLATRVVSTELTEMPFPAISYLSLGRSGCFVILYEADQRTVTWSHPEYGRLCTTLAVFDHIWSGILLLTELEYRAGYPAGKARGWRRWLPGATSTCSVIQHLSAV
jgi:ABC-type bacteriocin/lantibiotic exporter with double-glycine peptidase domain